jgi:D-alanine-D-alanine ligase
MIRVAVLMGGISAEREVSLSSGAMVAAALAEAGYEAVPVDATRNLPALLDELLRVNPDIVFNALHGRFGEDGCIQGILDWMGLRYTHSGPRASALAMDKPAAKAIFADAGLPVAPHRLVTAGELAAADPLQRPYVVKPVNEGSSVGVAIMTEGDNRRADIAAAWPPREPVMAEAFIPGRELTVAVLGAEPLAVTEITTARGFYDYAAKYEEGGSRHILPAAIPPEVTEAARAISLAAHEALGCRGASRADLRWDDSRPGASGLVLLELNTQPGMTPTSLLPEQAAFRGIDFPALCARILREALDAA